jgi:hypothetical protein
LNRRNTKEAKVGIAPAFFAVFCKNRRAKMKKLNGFG